MCIAPGVTATITNNINVNNLALTINVSGILHLSNATGSQIGAAKVNVASGGSITVPNDAKLHFFHTNVTNLGAIIVGHLENEHTVFLNEAAGKVTINGTWYQHGKLINRGQIETLCGTFSPVNGITPCEFLVGQKGDEDFYNEGSISVTGPANIRGRVNTTCGSQITVIDGYNTSTSSEIPGHLTIEKAIVGGGNVIGVTGSFANDGNVTGGTSGCRPQVFLTEGLGNDFNNRPNNVQTIDYDVNSALPVSLIDFKAALSENMVRLTWSTSLEENSGHFVVEKSNDAKKWIELGSVTAAGNSQTQVNYSFSDESGSNGVWYYRLKMVDVDGSFEYSTVKSVVIGLKATFGIIYPNPTSETLYIKDSDLEKVERIYIYNKLGRVVKSVHSFNSNAIDISHLTPGNYVVRVIYKDNNKSIHNIVVNK